MKRRLDPAVLAALAISTLAVALGIYAALRPPLVLVDAGPCVVIGPATHPDLVGPHLVVDCDGTQFGVRAVLP